MIAFRIQQIACKVLFDNLFQHSQSFDSAQNVQKLKAVLDEYLHIETLAANMLNLLIERIEIGHTVKMDGCRQQKITIVYQFGGRRNLKQE